MKTVDAIEDCRLIPKGRCDNNKHVCCEHNKHALENCASNDTTISINDKFWLYPGITMKNLKNFVLSFDVDGGSSPAFYFMKPPYTLPRDEQDPFSSHPVSCLSITESTNISIISSSTLSTKGRGLFHGGGPEWWGIPFIGYLLSLERRPKLLQITRSKDIEIRNVDFQDGALYALYLNGVENAHIHHCSVVSRRVTRENNKKSHPLLDLSAFNTDGIDVAGHNIHIHDVDIWTQDDCVVVKDNYLGDGISRDITIRNVNASGLGLVIGSIGGTTVQNVTIANSLLYHTFKGIYIKFRDYDMIQLPEKDHYRDLSSSSSSQPSSQIQGILFENITMVQPEQWAVWMGPAQQTDGHQYNPCGASPCSLCWPYVPGAQCLAPNRYVSSLSNVTLRNVSIINPVRSPGVLLGSTKSPLTNIIFEDVVVLEDSTVMFEIEKLRETFPGLDLQVNDPYLKRGIILVLVLIAFVVLIVSIILGFRYYWRWVWQHHTAASRGFMLVPGSDDDNDVENEDSSGSEIIDCVADDDGSDDNNNNNPAIEGRELTDDPVATTTIDNAMPPLMDDTSATMEDIRSPKSRNCQKFVLFFLLFFVIVVIVWNLRLHHKMTKVDKYFLCTGVENGVAKGHTWPVPECLQDETV